MRIKHIFSDMDGTLLNSQGKLSDRNAELITQSQLPLTLVSARAPIEMKDVIDKLGLTGAQIGFNGGLIYRYKDNHLQVLHQQPLEKDDTAELIQMFNRHYPHISQFYYGLEDWYTYKMDSGIEYQEKMTGQSVTIIDEEAYMKAEFPIFKIMLISFNADELKSLKHILKESNLPNISIHQTSEIQIEITHQKAQKSKGIDYIIREEKLQTNEVAAFGDGSNDIPMFERVGFGIAMANASDSIKDKVDIVTKSNDEDGVGFGIHNYLL